jgi:hypothetical protein
MRAATSTLALATALAVPLMIADGVRAQAAAGDKAAAEMLFDRGVTLMREGKLEEGCIQLEQSLSIEAGVGTMLYLAECYEKVGRIASAWAMFREAASAAREAGQPERAKQGNDRAAQLAPKLSMLTIQVAPENAVKGFALMRNGTQVNQGLWNVPVPVDPGEHSLQAQAPGRLDWSTQVSVRGDADSVTVRVPQLDEDPNAAQAAAEVPATEVGPVPAFDSTAATSPSDTAENAWPVQRTAGAVVAGVGVVALGIGGYFGVRAIGKNGDAKDACPQDTCNVREGIEAHKSADDAATLSTVFMIGGAVATATGVVLYLTAEPEENAPRVALGVDGSGARLTLGGAF